MSNKTFKKFKKKFLTRENIIKTVVIISTIALILASIAPFVFSSY